MYIKSEIEHQCIDARSTLTMAGDTQTANATCFVCDDRLSHAGIPLSCGLTASSRTELPTKISQVMGDGFIVVCSTDDKICTRCSSLLNQFDKLETDLAAVHRALTGYLNKKYNLLQIPVSQIEIEEETEPIISYDASEAPDPVVDNTLQENILQEVTEGDTSLHDFTEQEDSTTAPLDATNASSHNEIDAIVQNEIDALDTNKHCKWYKCNRCSFRTLQFRLMTKHKTKCSRLTCSMCDSHFENQKQLRAHVISQHLATWPCHFCGLTFTDQAEFTTHVSAHLQSLNSNAVEGTSRQDEEEDEFIEVDVLGGEDTAEGLSAADTRYIETDQDAEVTDEISVVLDLENQQGLASGTQELTSVDQWEAGEDKDKLALIWEGLEDAGECEEGGKEPLQCLACSLTFFNKSVLEQHLRTHAIDCRPPRAQDMRDDDGSEDEDLETLIDRMRARSVVTGDVAWSNGGQAEEEGSDHGVDCVADMTQLIRAKKLSSVDAAEHADLLLVGDSLHSGENGDQEAQGKASALICSKCGIEQPNMRALRAHRLMHLPGGVHSCDACDATFLRERQLVEHVANTHRDPHCRYCGKEILKAKTLRSHEQRHERGGHRTYDCTGCTRTFKTATGLRHHAAVHTGEYKYCCDFCGRGFMSRMMMEEHRVRHTKEERYVCDICGKKFSFQSTYWIHRKWHDTPMPYKCPFCGRLFKHSSLLAVHRRKHTGERPYKCPHCPLSFPVGGTLKRHLILHTGVYPFVCEFCKRGFTTKHKYLQHLQKAHQVVMEIKPTKSELRMAIREPSNDTAVNADTLLDWEMADDSTFMLMDDGGTEMDEIILEDAMIPCHVVAADAAVDDQGQMVQIVMDDTPAGEGGSLIGDLWPTYSVG